MPCVSSRRSAPLPRCSVKYAARVRIESYADVTVEADDEDTARDFALTAGFETPFPEISDIEIEWIERDDVPRA